MLVVHSRDWTKDYCDYINIGLWKAEFKTFLLMSFLN